MKKAILTIITILWAVLASAQESQTEYNFLRLPVSAHAAALGGVDIIVFTGGVGENQASCRAAACQGLEYMGVKMDEDANNVRGEERVISATDSKVKVLLIPTNEELMIAQDTAELVNAAKK